LYALVDRIPKDVVAVAESGIETAEELNLLRKAGFNGFLIGSKFMETSQPHLACKQLAFNYSKYLESDGQ